MIRNCWCFWLKISFSILLENILSVIVPEWDVILERVFIHWVFQIEVKGGEKSPPPCGDAIRNFTEWKFFTGWREPEEEWFWQFQPFSEWKTAFCEYWTSIKTKINMTCVSKEYEIKTKMEQEQWLQLKVLFLLGNSLKIVA